MFRQQELALHNGFLQQRRLKNAFLMNYSSKAINMFMRLCQQFLMGIWFCMATYQPMSTVQCALAPASARTKVFWIFEICSAPMLLVVQCKFVEPLRAKRFYTNTFYKQYNVSYNRNLSSPNVFYNESCCTLQLWRTTKLKQTTCSHVHPLFWTFYGKLVFPCRDGN